MYTLSRGLPRLMHELSDFVYFGPVWQNSRAFPLKHVLSSAPLKPTLNPKLFTRIWSQKKP
jgi:hypothetical protein